MAWTPSELSSVNLVSELLYRAEHLLVVIKVLEESLQLLVDIVVNPMSVLELDDQVERVDVGQMLLASFNFLEVIEEHEHDSHNLFPVEEIKNL